MFSFALGVGQLYQVTNAGHGRLFEDVHSRGLLLLQLGLSVVEEGEGLDMRLLLVDAILEFGLVAYINCWDLFS